MQEKGAVFARVRAVAEVAKRAHYYEGQQNELNGILSEMAEHERQRAIAIEQGDREREEAQRALILTCGTQRGIRKGAADYAETLAACERIEAAGAASTDAEGVEEA